MGAHGDDLHEYAAGTGRVEAFSDGVFAIAVTLLVLDLLDPRADPRAIEAIHRAYAYGPLLYLGAFALAAVSVPACLAVNVALAVFFALPPRHQGKLSRPRP